MSHDYDVALSFAGEQRKYVEEVADALKGRGYRVFYDKHEAAWMWGKDATALTDLYFKRAKFCIVFVSKAYARKMWPRAEFRAAAARALESVEQEYILPVRFDDSELPGLLPSVIYLDAREFSPEEIATIFYAKASDSSNLQVPTDPSRVSNEKKGPRFACKPGIYPASGDPNPLPLEIEGGERLSGMLHEEDGYAFSYYLVDRQNYTKFLNRRMFEALDAGHDEIAYDIDVRIPHDGPWFLILEAPRAKLERDVSVDLQREDEMHWARRRLKGY